jgi:hypothetical protein
MNALVRHVLVIVCLSLALLAPAASGHVVDSVELELRHDPGQWELTGLLDITFMLPETRGDPNALPLDRLDVMAEPPEVLEEMRRHTEATLRRILAFTFDHEPLPWRLEFPEFDSDPVVLPDEPGGWAFFTGRILIDPVRTPGELRVVWTDEEDTELIIVVDDEVDPRIVSTSSGRSSVLLRVDADGQVATPGTTETGWGWLVSGYRHVLPLGLDHLLFIIGLFLLAPRWKPLLWQSLLFTLAHSITLALAVFGWVNLPEQPVEILIAASIAWIGFENLRMRELRPRRLFLVFGFGLLHGLGFASVLSEQLAMVPHERLALPLVWFNVGVEAAQVTVLAVAFLLWWPLRAKTVAIQRWGSVVVALAGVGWVVERIFFA